MKKQSIWLLDFQSNEFSQKGEDGIIGKMLECLPRRDKWCVEFGAWDGIRYSNTRNLIENYNYAAVLIECDKRKFKELKENNSLHQEVITINQFVGYEKSDCLDTILAKTPIPEDFDFLSIDIDGNDYHVWKATERYMPKRLLIEIKEVREISW